MEARISHAGGQWEPDFIFSWAVDPWRACSFSDHGYLVVVDPHTDIPNKELGEWRGPRQRRWTTAGRGMCHLANTGDVGGLPAPRVEATSGGGARVDGASHTGGL
jgi:hypothetical protein